MLCFYQLAVTEKGLTIAILIRPVFVRAIWISRLGAEGFRPEREA